MFKTAPPVAIPKLKLQHKNGGLTGSVSIVRREQDHTETPVYETQHDGPGTNVSGTTETITGISGVGYGLTLPGPEKSYLAARIDAFCYLPHAGTDEAAADAMKRASALVQTQLEAEAAEVYEFFQNWKRP